MKILINEKQLHFLVEQVTDQPKIYNRPGDPYEYKFQDNTWFARKKGTNGNFLDITKYQKSIDILNKEFPQNQTKQEAPAKKEELQSPAKKEVNQEQTPQKQSNNQSKVAKNSLDSIINAVTSNPNVAKFMKLQTSQEGSWKPGTLNYDNNNPGNMLPDDLLRKIDPNLTVTPRSKYAKFSTPELGFTAYVNKILRWSKGGMPAYDASTKMVVNPQYNKGRKHTAYVKGQVPTLAQFIYQWAPPNENDSEAYIDFILKAFPGKTSETPMTELLGI
jgi:hypothetical protein